MSKKFVIRKASNNDIAKIEDILKDVVLWMKEKDIKNLWKEENIKWKYLSKSYKKTIRLDFNKQRDKLRELYQKNGFRYVKEQVISKDYVLDLYIYNLK